MGMPKKGSRRIVVGEQAYRWFATDAEPPPGAAVWIEREGGGQRLHTEVDPDGGVVSPGLVRRLVLAGIAGGWRPDAPGLTPFALDSGVLDRAHFIDVDGHVYEWLARASWHSVRVSVTPVSPGGQRLEASISLRLLGPGDIGTVDVVTPLLVRKIVTSGLAAGWTPTARELPPFEIGAAAIGLR